MLITRFITSLLLDYEQLPITAKPSIRTSKSCLVRDPLDLKSVNLHTPQIGRTSYFQLCFLLYSRFRYTQEIALRRVSTGYRWPPRRRVVAYLPPYFLRCLLWLMIPWITHKHEVQGLFVYTAES